MNYRHGYHAGNLADILKHLTLAHLLAHLRGKETPFGVLDTHAGAGSYDLRALEALKTNEAQSGVYAFTRLPEHLALAPLQDVLKKWNLGMRLGAEFVEGMLRFYPGSPAIIQHYLRADDRLTVVEKHPEEFKKLRKMLSPFANMQLHERDGFEALSALLPLQEKRTLVFIDPPYEQPDEMEKAFKAVVKAHARASSTIFALWYPLADVIAAAALKEKFAASALPKILCVEAEYAPEKNLKGCGMILVNPPWQIDVKLTEALALLHPLFAQGASAAEVQWIKGEEA